MEATHASFFSGVGGLDLGLERAGWRTVSFSEIDPYASAVLAERWPGVPNLGDITAVSARDLDPGSDGRVSGRDGRERAESGAAGRGRRIEPGADGADWRDATLWSGGFPCQDLSIAGKRRGMGAGTRSGLAFSFLDLVGRYRPRFVLLENVPGLLSSHAGRDFGTLLSTLVELGYGVGYRVLDARYFGVPQRRRRVFILGDSTGGRAGAERAAEVLSVGSRCHRHPPTGIEAGEDAATGARPGVDIARTVVGTAGKRHDEDIDTLVPTVRSHPRPGSNSAGLLAVGIRSKPYADHISDEPNLIVRSSPDPDRVRAADGLAGRAHDHEVELVQGGEASYHQRDRIYGHTAPTLDAYGDTPSDAPLISVYVKGKRAQTDQDDETWRDSGVMPTLNSFDVGDVRTTAAIIGAGPADDPLLPLGLDSHRYRCCGNGVVADVAEWIGRRLLAAIEEVA